MADRARSAKVPAIVARSEARSPGVHARRPAPKIARAKLRRRTLRTILARPSMKKPWKRWLAGALACAAAALAHAQAAWPDHSVQLIVPYPAGGGVDIIARPFAEAFGEALHQPIVVMNRPGASGTIGAAAASMVKPDGYALAFTANGPLTIQPHVLPNLPYKRDSLLPVCQVFAVQYVIAVRPDSPYRTLPELIAAVKAKPGKVSYGFGGVATAPHLAISQLAIAANLDMLSVPFRDDPQAILALKGGEIDSAVLNLGMARAQGFRSLATFADKRQAELPDTPTVKELGYPVASSAFGGVFAPKGLAPEIVKRIDTACEKAVADARFRRATIAADQEPIYRDSAAFASVLDADFATKGDVVKRAGIKAP
jgi:tripartite-type tricarboxylate transporter receptor subunit TctC